MLMIRNMCPEFDSQTTNQLEMCGFIFIPIFNLAGKKAKMKMEILPFHLCTFSSPYPVLGIKMRYILHFSSRAMPVKNKENLTNF